MPAEAIAAVGSCGQMHGPVGIDDAGNVTTPWVQLWCDKRCQTQVEAVRSQHDETELVGDRRQPDQSGMDRIEGPLAQGQRAGILSPCAMVSGPQGFH